MLASALVQASKPTDNGLMTRWERLQPFSRESLQLHVPEDLHFPMITTWQQCNFWTESIYTNSSRDWKNRATHWSSVQVDSMMLSFSKEANNAISSCVPCWCIPSHHFPVKLQPRLAQTEVSFATSDTSRLHQQDTTQHSTRQGGSHSTCQEELAQCDQM